MKLHHILVTGILLCTYIQLSAQFPDTTSASLSFGTNFDFLDGVKASELYADFRYDGVIKSSKRWSFESGITQQRTVTYQDTSIKKTYYDIFAATPPPTLDLDYVTIKVKESSKVQVENLNINITPKWQITKPEATQKSQLLLIANMEVIRSKTIFTSNVGVESRDTSKMPNIPIPYDLTPVPKAGESKYTSYLFYGGVGIEYQHRDKNADFKLRVVPGYRYSSSRQVGLDALGQGSTAYSYLFQMEILEKKIAGIKLGTEVRGTFGEQTFPWISIYLAKRFSLSKLAELFSAK